MSDDKKKLAECAVSSVDISAVVANEITRAFEGAESGRVAIPLAQNITQQSMSACLAGKSFALDKSCLTESIDIAKQMVTAVNTQHPDIVQNTLTAGIVDSSISAIPLQAYAACVAGKRSEKQGPGA